MKDKERIITPLVEKFEEYGKINLNLLKLRLVDKTTETLSILISHFILLVVVLFFTFALTMAAALWLSDLLGKNYIGFLLIAIFYAVVTLILMIIHPYIKERISDSLIKKAFN